MAVRCAFVLCLVGLWAAPARAAPPCDVPANAIVAENCLPGSPPSQWDVVGAGDESIQGFATDISVNRGGTIQFKADTDATDYRLDVYRMGYYAGMGARLVATVQPSVTLPQTQPACLTDPATGLVDCGNWGVSASWPVPVNATSGIYFAKLVREDPEDGRASHVVFVVRYDDGASQLLFQTNDTTWQAYNAYGGNSLYTGSPAGRAYKVSYNRPFTTRCCQFPAGGVEAWLFRAPYPMVRWLEANGYDVSYMSGVDADRIGSEILEHSVFLSVGHDEYWSAGQRANVEAARAAGVHLGFFSGNEVFWKVRWEPSIDASAAPYRTLVCYKETHANAKIDPLPGVWTGTWRDPRFSPPADGGRPENALTGTIFTVNGIRNDALAVPEADGKLRFWRDTSIATLAPGQTATMAAGTLGFEWDEDLDNGFRPAGVMRLSSVTVSGVPLLQDFGSTYASGTATHHLTLHRHASGALVFGAGTVQWSWGLDATHDGAGPAADIRMKQATVNLLADMGVQPATLQPGLVPATASTDAAAPSSTITSPAGGASLVLGQAITVTGMASDAGGGRVGGVEVSLDGGGTWHPAAGRASWTYGWVPGAIGSVTLESRAVDDSGNLEVPSAGVTVSVFAPGQDLDGDGFPGPGDCNDADPTVFPGAPELCDGKDNDCDTVVDEGDPGGGASCSTGQPGVCGPGTRHCVNSTLACTANLEPSADICDDLDNDCDGQTDEGNPGGGGPCGVSNVGVCHFGTQTCLGGALVCVGNVDPSPEQCNGLDDDCDGTADDGDPGSGASCSTGQPGVCGPGTTQCTGGAIQCVRNVNPSAEACDGLDNDCDGALDEGNPGGGASCSTGLLGACAAGTRQCLGGGLVCVPNTPAAAETCNGIDDDCDGAVDEGNPGGGACATGRLGVCAAGTYQCQSGLLICVGPSASAEVCDGLDNDCDGQVDEANVCCGNGQLDAGEACDGGACCDSTCQFKPATAPCNDGNACTAGDHCTGAGACVGGTCQVGTPCGVVCGQTKTCQQPQPGMCQCQ